nr:mediator of RNA polymerase II transcription subunit 19A-like [Ipomoea batatas]
MLIFVIDSIHCQVFLNLEQQNDLSGWASVSVIIGLCSSSNALVDHCKTISNAYMPSFLQCSFFPPLVRIGEYTIVLMDPEGRKFGRGPRELGGSIDLLNYYKLERHHEFFCKRSLPSSISKTQYLQNVVGETEIRKGEGMELDQLFQKSTSVGCGHKPLHPFKLDVLMDAFQLQEATSTDLPYTKKRASDGSNLKGEGREEKKHKKHKHKNRESKKDKHKNIETKMGSNMQSHPRIDASRDKDKEYKRTGDHSFGSDHFLKQQRVSKISTFLPL